jgi:cell division protein FtsB
MGVEEKPSWAEIGKLTQQIKELKSELEGKEDSFHFAITDLQTKGEQLKAENQSLHDQITEMEKERSKIDKIAQTISQAAVSIIHLP